MANTGAGKGGKGAAAGEKTGGSDTLNFTYSSAVEAALEQLEIDKEEEAKPTPRKKKTKKGKDDPVTEEIKPRQKIEVFKLDQIYNDWCQIRELNTPRTDRSTHQVAAQNPPGVNNRNNQPPPGTASHTRTSQAPPAPPPGSGAEPDVTTTKQDDQSPERKGEGRKDAEGRKDWSPEERRKRERDKDEETVENKSGHVKG